MTKKSATECMDAIKEMKIKSDFDDAAFARVKAERDQLERSHD